MGLPFYYSYTYLIVLLYSIMLPVLTCQHHAFLETFLEAAVLTTIALGFVNLTVSISDARVNSFVLNGSLEETFTSFAGYDTIMKTSSTIFAYHTGQYFFILMAGLHWPTAA